MEDKSKFIKGLGELISKYARADVEGFTYNEKREVIEVRFINGYCKDINVAGDSCTAMLNDVGRFFERC